MVGSQKNCTVTLRAFPLRRQTAQIWLSEGYRLNMNKPYWSQETAQDWKKNEQNTTTSHVIAHCPRSYKSFCSLFCLLRYSSSGRLDHGSKHLEVKRIHAWTPAQCSIILKLLLDATRRDCSLITHLDLSSTYDVHNKHIQMMVQYCNNSIGHYINCS